MGNRLRKRLHKCVKRAKGGSPWSLLFLAIALAFVILGIVGLFDAVAPLIAVSATAVAALLLLLRCVDSGRWFVTTMRAVGAVVIALVSLAGLNVALYLAGLKPDISIPLGLVLAAVLMALAIVWYLHYRQYGWLPLGGALALMLLLLFAAPVAKHLLSPDNSRHVAKPHQVRSKLEVMIVTDGSSHTRVAEPPPDPSLEEFDVTYSVGFARGDGVRWTLLNGTDREEALDAVAEGGARPVRAGSPGRRPEADSVLLLLVDGTRPVTERADALPQRPGEPGEVGRWRRIAEAAAFRRTATFALLQSTDPQRFRNWRQGFGTQGTAISVQALESQTVTDSAVRLAVYSPTSREDFALAMRFRPVLLFDRHEPDPWPYSIDALFAEGRVRLCNDQKLKGTECGDAIMHSRELKNGDTHLSLTLPSSDSLKALAREQLKAQEELRPGDLEREESPHGALPEGVPSPALPVAAATPAATVNTAIYVHPTSVGSLLYLDYWWYLTDNPVAVGDGALCGAGLVIAGVTCLNHQSDWEGMTVVVNRGGTEPRIVAVQYAQHSDVVRYGWGLLKRRWRRQDIQARVAGIEDASTRPLAFSAEGTHSTYPTPCGGSCDQVADPVLKDDSHDGWLKWVGDDTTACGGSSCLQLLPTRNGGERPALWSAFDGPWGELECFLTVYCSSATPPESPGQQGRYKNPEDVDGYMDRRWHFHSE